MKALPGACLSTISAYSRSLRLHAHNAIIYPPIIPVPFLHVCFLLPGNSCYSLSFLYFLLCLGLSLLSRPFLPFHSSCHSFTQTPKSREQPTRPVLYLTDPIPSLPFLSFPFYFFRGPWWHSHFKMLVIYLLASLLAAMSVAAQSQPKSVFAHFMVSMLAIRPDTRPCYRTLADIGLPGRKRCVDDSRAMGI